MKKTSLYAKAQAILRALQKTLGNLLSIGSVLQAPRDRDTARTLTLLFVHTCALIAKL